MFTGIIEELGQVQSLSRGAKSARLVVQAGVVLEETKIGDSIAVNGVCLTVTDMSGRTFSADIMAETLDKSNLGDLHPGQRVNLERAMALGARLGGHLVSGHIDGVGTILGQEKVDIALVTEISAPPQVLKYVIRKGSIAIDGISLTVIDVTDRSFSVSLIPHTAKLTTLGFKKAGDKVNLEGDLIGKYIERLMGFRGEEEKTKSGMTTQWLAENGFI